MGNTIEFSMKTALPRPGYYFVYEIVTEEQREKFTEYRDKRTPKTRREDFEELKEKYEEEFKQDSENKKQNEINKVPSGFLIAMSFPIIGILFIVVILELIKIPKTHNKNTGFNTTEEYYSNVVIETQRIMTFPEFVLLIQTKFPELLVEDGIPLVVFYNKIIKDFSHQHRFSWKL